MKKISLLLALSALFFFGVSPANAASPQTMLNYLDKYCDDISPVSGCGSYQDEVNESSAKAKKIMALIAKQPKENQKKLVNMLLDLLEKSYDRSSGVTKFMSAYYYVYFAGVIDSSVDTMDLFEYLFDDGTYTYYEYEYEYDYDSNDAYDDEDAEIVRVIGGNGYTTVNESRDRITVSRNDFSVRVQAETDDGKDASQSAGYRVVAMFDDRRYDDEVYGANYDGNGYWEFTFGTQFSASKEIRFYVLCKNCDSGSRFTRGNVFEDWRVVDSATYDLDYRATAGSSYYDGYYGYGDNEDLGISDIRYDYDMFSNEVQVEIQVTVMNYGIYDATLDEITFDVEVDNRSFSSSRYDINHISTECDDRTISRSRDENINIDRDDECELIFRIDFDRDDVEDEDVDIEVMLEVRGDDEPRNNDETLSFYVN